MSTLPPFSPYACLTELVHASVSASLRSCSVSSETGRTPAIAVRASRPRVMYSGLAGMVRRTERPSSLMGDALPTRGALLTRRNRRRSRRRSRVRILVVRFRALAEADRQGQRPAVADDLERHGLPRAETCDNPRNIFGAPHLLTVDRDDHVA